MALSKLRAKAWWRDHTKTVRLISKWMSRCLEFAVKEIERLKMMSHAKARGPCVWCQSPILEKQLACAICYPCNDFRGSLEVKEPKYIHFQCGDESGCRECTEGMLRRIQ